MPKNLIKTVARMIQEGWRPYDAQPAQEVYEQLQCPYAGGKPPKRPYWFSRGDVFCCIACSRACCLNRPKGFPPALPINYPAELEGYSRPPQELVKIRHTLTAKEAAYCLNLSERKIYQMVVEGELVALRDRGVIRIRASDVEALMYDFDE
jgi:excisionase family DNA binding protein